MEVDAVAEVDAAASHRGGGSQDTQLAQQLAQELKLSDGVVDQVAVGSQTTSMR